jgi:hypothetical protein
MPISKTIQNKIKVMLFNNKITFFDVEEKDPEGSGLFRPRNLY